MSTEQVADVRDQAIAGNAERAQGERVSEQRAIERSGGPSRQRAAALADVPVR